MTGTLFEPSAARVPARFLGSTTITVGRVGLGCMSLTGVYDVDHRDDDQAIRAVQLALDLGMSYLDTADSFGPFGSEKLLGRALAGRRESAVLATKVGITGRSDGTFHHNATPAHIRTSVDESLRRLQTDYLDVYQLQAVDPAVPVTESWGAMAELITAGKVRTLGVATDDIAVLTELQRVYPISVVTAEVSMRQPANLRLAAWANARGIALAATSPMDRGFLTGALNPGRVFPWTDLRSKLPAFKPAALRADHHLVETLRTVAHQVGGRPSQVALAWLLHQSPSILPIPGSRNAAHVAENAGATSVQIPDDQLEVLNNAVWPAAVSDSDRAVD